MDATQRVNWPLVATVFGLGAFLYLFELDDYRSLTTHEGFVAVVSREMLDSGDWIVPRYGELPRLKKPPLAYWSAATSSWLLGGSSEFAARLPSVIAALLLAALVGHWGARWYGPRVGMGAAIVQLSSLYVLTFARLAEVDMQLCLLTTAALYLIANHVAVPVSPALQPDTSASQIAGSSRRVGHPDRRWTSTLFSLRWTAIYALLGLAWLAKFHYGPVMVLAVCLVYTLVQRQWRNCLHWLNPAGLLIFAAAVCVWPYLVLQQLPGAWEIWQAETVGRAVGQLGSDPFWYYVPQALLLGQPWTPLTIVAMRGSWLSAWRQADPRERFLWIWFLTQLAILSASAFKHGHYLMAALPMFSLLGGKTLARIAEKATQGDELLGPRRTTAIGVACLVAAVVAGLLITRKWPMLTVPAIALAAWIGIGGALLALLIYLRRYAPAAVTAALLLVGCHVTVAGWIFPGRDHRRPHVEFAAEARRELPPAESVCVFGLSEHPVVYYVREPVFRLESKAELAERVARDGRLYAVMKESAAAEMDSLCRAETICRLQSPPEGPRYKDEPLVLVQLDAVAAAPRVATQGLVDAPARQ